MFLACDIGNTQIKTGLFKNDKPVHFRNFTDPDKLLNYIKSNNISGCGISSVVPDRLSVLGEKLKTILQFPPFVITKDVKFNLNVEYKSFETLGIDRLCSAEGAFSLYKQSTNFPSYSRNTSILTIDFGTATTVNLIRFPGNFIGGVIAPGIKMMLASLNEKTAQLPFVELSDFNGIIGQTTKSSIAGGVINASVGLISRVIEHLRLKENQNIFEIYVTGGNAETILNYLPFNYIYEKALVLYGIKAVSEINI